LQTVTVGPELDIAMMFIEMPLHCTTASVAIVEIAAFLFCTATDVK